MDKLKQVMVSRGAPLKGSETPTPMKRARRKTRQEKLVGWKPSPEKSLKLSSMFRGVPVNMKQVSLLETGINSPLKSEEVLRQGRNFDRGIVAKHRKVTCRASDKKTRRYLNFIEDAAKTAELRAKKEKDRRKNGAAKKVVVK